MFEVELAPLIKNRRSGLCLNPQSIGINGDYYLLSNPEHRQELQDEIKKNITPPKTTKKEEKMEIPEIRPEDLEFLSTVFGTD